MPGKSFHGLWLIPAIVLAFAGCSDPRRTGLNADGHEDANWLPEQHALAVARLAAAPDASGNAESCRECHGSDLEGGISGVSCSSCHLGGPLHAHPETWAPVSSDHMPYVQTNGTASCATRYCHGTSLNGVANSGPSCSSCHLGGSSLIHPPDWPQVSVNHAPYASLLGTASCANAACHGTDLNGVAGSGPSCSSCHMGGPTRVHPESWTNLYTAHGPEVSASDASACSNAACHGPDLAGVSGSGPACGTCHAWPLAPGAPVELICGSCHGVPPNGASSPNRAGVHSVHASLSGVTCSSCHSGSDVAADNPLHLNLVPDVIFDAPYDSKSGTASFDAASSTCANVSCHGGPRTQTLEQALAGVPAGTAPLSTAVGTPTWYGGKLNTTAEVNNLCLACHTYEPGQGTEYNNYFSGRHFIHLYDQERGPFPKFQCNDCHDITTLLPVNHWTSLGTSTMEGPASATIRSFLNYDSVSTGCNPGCHEARVWTPPPVP